MAVLRSYSTFVRAAADRLQLPVFTPPDVPHHRRHERRPYTYLHTSLKSAHVHKKHKVQYETRTHWYTYTFTHLTGMLTAHTHNVHTHSTLAGSTADTLLEYLQRQLPEGVGMIVKKTQCLRVPAHLQSSDST
jgi:small subunit ribosomal protein S10